MKPILLKIAGIELYSYPLFIGLAWGVSFHLSRYFLLKDKCINYGLFLRLYFLVFLFAWLGAKLFFLIFSVPDQIELYSNSSSFWLGGGFVFYGGLVGGLVYLLIESLVLKSLRFSSLGLLVPALTISHAIGRIGCFLTGCCYGTHCDLPWSIHMHGDFRHPVQLYESAGLLGLGAIAIRMINKKQSLTKVMQLYIFGYAGLRFCLEFFRGDKLRGIHAAGLSTSQFVSLALVAIAAILFVRENYFRKKG